VPEVLLVERKEHVLLLTLNRPEAMNALNMALSGAIRDALRSYEEDDDLRAAIITGAGGRAFSAGADLKEMSASFDQVHQTSPGGVIRDPMGPRRRGSAGDCLKPLIAAIDGYCLAGGLELALGCDIRIATPQSKFGLTEVTRGIIAAGGGTQRLPRAIPQSLAMEVLLTGRHLDADEALRSGLVSSIVPSDQLLPRAFEIAEMIAANAPLAVQATKTSVRRGIHLPLEEALRVEATIAWMNTQTEDSREGPRAFAEKRPPNWKGC
jgi:enoyl-CoA hydratase/carnithine racemase